MTVGLQSQKLWYATSKTTLYLNMPTEVSGQFSIQSLLDMQQFIMDRHGKGHEPLLHARSINYRPVDNHMTKMPSECM